MTKITPPPELVKQWYNECPEANEASLPYVATQAARWGADQELEACCELVRDSDGYDAAQGLRAERRPKPPSLKEQALEELSLISISPESGVRVSALDTIRRALERLQELENND